MLLLPRSSFEFLWADTCFKLLSDGDGVLCHGLVSKGA